MGTWLRRLAYLFRQSRHEAELREEIEAHRALRAADLERRGLTSRDADEASRRAIGNVLLAREEAREVWLGSWATWWQDVRYGVRTFRRSPTFTAVAVVTLALGIGVNAGVFTVLNGALFRDLPVPAANQMVSISQTIQGVNDLIGQGTFSTSEYRAYRDRANTLSGLLAISNASGETTLGGDNPQKVYGALVSCNYFDVLRQPPALGRPLADRDCDAGADPVVVLGHDVWKTAFSANSDIVGRTVQLNRRPFTVVGVAAEGTYQGALKLGYFAPINTGRLLAAGDGRYENDRFLWLLVIGRQREGVGIDQVRAELAVIASQIDRQQPGRSTTLAIERAKHLTVPPGLRGAATGTAAVLMGAFGFILLIACANVANLFLARGTSRGHEIGIRLSLGASRARVFRQLMTESMLIAIAGGVLGSVLALWSFQWLVALAVPALVPPELPMSPAWDLSPNVLVLSFASALTFGTGILFGLVPALHVSSSSPHVCTKQDSAAAGSGRRGGRVRATLVGVQVALCMVLMIAAGLLLRGLHATYTIDLGYDYRDVAVVSLESAVDLSREDFEALRQRLIARVEVMPGVVAVASADQDPLGDDFAPVAIRLPGEGEQTARHGEAITVTARYFSVLGLPIVRGRAFTDADVRRSQSGARPAIVSEATARNLWPGGDPIGRLLLSEHDTLQVVGVAADAQVNAIGYVDPYHVYVPGAGSVLLIKSRNDFATTAAGIRAILRSLDPSLVLTILPLAANLGWWRGISSTVTTLASGLGVLALVLATVGVYGVVSYAVTGRYREIGVRLALGATARNVLAMILRQTMRPVVVGASIGIAAASAMSRVLTSVLFGVSPVDPIGLGGGALLVVGLAFAAGLVAARPATRADPTTTLRYE
jgi:putative ABC transport system permease protein